MPADELFPRPTHQLLGPAVGVEKFPGVRVSHEGGVRGCLHQHAVALFAFPQIAPACFWSVMS